MLTTRKSTIVESAVDHFIMRAPSHLASVNMLSHAFAFINNSISLVGGDFTSYPSPRLKSCNTSDEMHHNRHKEILSIVREINTLDGADSTLNFHFIKRKSSAEEKETESERASTEAAEITSEKSYGETSLRRRERKKAKKSVRRGRKDVEIFSQDDINGISEALHLTVHESKGAWWGTYTYDGRFSGPLMDDAEILEEKEEREAEECHDYAVQPPTPASKKVFLHPKHPTPKQQRASKRMMMATPPKQAKLRGHQQRFNHDAASKKDPYSGVDCEIFYRLGIDIDPADNSKARKELVSKLAAAIKHDLEIMRREEEETVMREAGFWRWAGRAAFRNIMNYREKFDWATGQKRVGRTEEEVFGNDMDKNYEKDLCGDMNDQMNDTLDKDAQAKWPVEGEENKGKDRETIDKSSRNSKVRGEGMKRAEVKVLKITNVPESTWNPRSKDTRFITKWSQKKAWSTLGPEGFVNTPADSMAKQGLSDLVAHFGRTESKKESPCMGITGRNISGITTVGAHRAPEWTVSSDDEEEWTTVGKKGKEKN
ncbi:hypothetical protein ACMFMF_010678 [Clarireedia jacksonii]